MFWFKGCPKCAGDLYMSDDSYGPFVACAQCGFQKDVPEETNGFSEFPLLYSSASGSGAPLSEAKVGEAS